MYINFIHYYVPQVFGTLAFLVNPVFVYLIFLDKVATLGNYRFLLLYFAFFNLIYSTTVLLFPINIHTYRYCFSIFTSGGIFQSSSTWNLNLLIIRCSLIACSYAVLLSHFIYRYLVVSSSKWTSTKFPLYMLATFFLAALFFSFGFAICKFLNSPVAKDYVRENYMAEYGVNSTDLNIIAAIYDEVPDGLERQSYAAIGLLSIQSVTSLSLFVALGTMIIKRLNPIAFNMSEKTSQLQRQLMKALAIQTVIPIFISFSPCVLSWYSPMFNVNMGSGVSQIEVIALATFPFFDPVAIVLCLPVLRHRIFPRKQTMLIKSIELTSTRIQ